jgi:hypothetical protein
MKGAGLLGGSFEPLATNGVLDPLASLRRAERDSASRLHPRLPLLGGQQANAATVRQGLLDAASAARKAAELIAKRLVREPRIRFETVPGVAAAIDAIALPRAPGRVSTLAATREVNEQTSTVRASAASLGLDVTTPERASVVTSAQEVNTATSTVRTSSAAVGLDALTPEAASTLTSAAELNTAPTSYEKVQLTFSSGTSKGSLSGVYAGTGSASGATSLQFQFQNNVTLSSTVAKTLKFRVRDQSGATLFTFNGSVKAGDVISLGADIGLSVKFSAGTVVLGATSTTGVSSTTPTDVSPTAVFNAADPNLRPRFEGGAQVVAGSFTVNGAVINVAAGDTIDAVLAKINASTAGVTATFSGDKLTLATVGPSEQDIVLGTDTSGFLAATKLVASAFNPVAPTTVRGNVHDDVETFAQSAQLGSVQTGSFSVNGVAISVDRDTDSLASVLARVSSSPAGVTAHYDAASDTVVLTPQVEGAALVLGDDTSGLLAAVNVAQGAQGTAADPDSPFNGTGLDAPLFDAGQSVVAGSFTVNGARIDVAADDTIRAVLDKINASGAGLVATWSADRVAISTAGNSEQPIVFADDTSGFLAATKLAGASTVTGVVRDDLETFAQSARLGSVQTGSFAVNGVTISVDRDADSLSSVLARINASGAGVEAAYDAPSSKVVFTPATPGATLVLGDDTSGLLSALGIASGAAGTHLDPNAAFDGTGMLDPLFDPGVSVSAGSFQVNGTTIEVRADDSVTSVLARINASGAGVVASYDNATDRVQMVTTAPTGSPIRLENDTSGFVRAVKLDTAQSTVGTLDQSPTDALLADLFPGVVAGTLTVNGHAVAIAPDQQTLRDIASAIDRLGGVSATLESGTAQLHLRSDASATSLALGDTSGLLAALHIGAGVTRGTAARTVAVNEGEGTPRIDYPPRAAHEAFAALQSLDQALGALAGPGKATRELASDVRLAITSALATAGGDVAAAVRLEERSGQLRLVVDEGKLADALRGAPSALDSLLVGGIASGLESAVADFDAAEEAARKRAEALEGNRSATALSLPPVDVFRAALAHSTSTALMKTFETLGQGEEGRNERRFGWSFGETDGDRALRVGEQEPEGGRRWATGMRTADSRTLAAYGIARSIWDTTRTDTERFGPEEADDWFKLGR